MLLIVCWSLDGIVYYEMFSTFSGDYQEKSMQIEVQPSAPVQSLNESK